MEMPIKCDLTPLVQSIPNGVGKIFDLVFGRKIARIEAAKKLINAQTEREAQYIIEGKGDIDDKGKFIDHNQTAENNFNECVEFAVSDALNREDSPSTEDISRTFFNKWREHAKTIDEAHLKQLWGRILVNEVYEPNSINLRVLNALSMLSTEDAKIFQSCMKYMLRDEYIIVDFIPQDERLQILKALFSIGAIVELPSSAFVIKNNIDYYNSNGHSFDFLYQQNDNICIAFNFNSDLPQENLEHVSLQLIDVTEIGKALYKLAFYFDKNLSISLVDSISNDISEKYIDIISISVYKMNQNTIEEEIYHKELR